MRIASLALASLLLFSAPLHAADASDYTIRATTSEVRIAFAADRQGQIVKTLRSSDVAVEDNGWIIRHFRSFRPAAESPLELVLLLDASDSVASQIPKEIADAQSFVANSTWGERDRVSILSFGGTQPQLLCARNCRTSDAQNRLNALRANGATPLYDALMQAAEILTQNHDPEARPAMILFSDGHDTVSMHSYSDALEAAQALQAPIYAVNTRPEISSPGKGDLVLNYLAAGTGGLSFGTGQDVKQVLQAVLGDLHSGYVLTYDLPEKTAGQHTIRVLPTGDPRLHFRSRTAYNENSNE